MNRTVSVAPPINASREQVAFLSDYYSYEITELKCLQPKNVFVTYSGLCVNGKGLMKECHHDHPYQLHRYHGEAAYYLNDIVKHPENLISLKNEKNYLLIHHPWFNYYHWICEAIPRLWMVREHLSDLTLLLPAYYQKSDFIMGSLEPFKIKDIFFIPDKKSLFLKKLFLPQIKPICDSYHQEELKAIGAFYRKYVREELKLSIDLGKRLYISRKKAARKKVTNESEIEEILTRHGFHIICNEDYTFLEQVSIFSHAEHLVSIHGSGLTNMLFMPAGSSVFELLKTKTNDLDRPSFVFWYQADALGFKYVQQFTPPISEPDDYFFGDFHIDPVKFEQNLELMLYSS